MRNVDSILEERLNSTQQTAANNANPSTWLRVRRHDIPLRDGAFIDRFRIVNREGLTDSDIAVCHPRFGMENSAMWVAYVRNGTLHIKHASTHEVVTRAEWSDYWFTDDAVSCSIAFNSVAKHNANDIWEFVTEEIPWVFWVTPDGALKAKLCTPLGQYEEELAQANVTDVSAVRGPSGEWGNWDMGLTVFFVMNGSIYYRQYINKTWYDAELIQFTGLSNINISKIKAFNTWDHRAGVQILATDGKLYELFSYTEGIGTRGTEHLEISDIRANVSMNDITYYDSAFAENVGISDIQAYVRMILGNSATPISVVNTSSTTVKITFDLEQTDDNVDTSMFELWDTSGNYYLCSNVSVDDEYVTLGFDDFSRSKNDVLTVRYTKPDEGGLMSPSCQTESFTETFEPTNLNIPSTPQPTFSNGANSDDMTITLTLSQSLINSSLIDDIESHFSIEVQEFNYVPGGHIETTYRTLDSVIRTGGTTLELTINAPNFSSAVGNGSITIVYDGRGGLKGAGGMVKAFRGSFTPADLTWKGHQNDIEHIKISNITASVTLRNAEYINGYEWEHLNISDVVASVTLINVHDL